MKKTKDQGPAVKVTDHTIIADELKTEVVTDRRIELTVERAIAFLEMPVFSGERNVSQTHVQYLYDQWRTGRFMWEQALIAVGMLDGASYRLNGQHTCWMRWGIDENNGKLKEEPRIREIVYKVKTMEDLRGLYCTFDRNKTRTNGHSFKALIIGSSMTDGLWTSLLGHLGAGLMMYKFGDTTEARAMAPEDMAQISLKNYPELFKSVGMLLQDLWDAFRPLRRKGVLGALFATMEAQPTRCKDFWGPVATGLTLNEETDARYKLRQFLEKHGHQQSSAKEASVISPEDAYRVCIGAWNRWRKNEPVSVLKSSEKRVKPV